jgi:hypothetical protein
MGIMPSQQPSTVPIAGKTNARSTPFRGLILPVRSERHAYGKRITDESSANNLTQVHLLTTGPDPEPRKGTPIV